MMLIENQSYQEERSLYGISAAGVRSCRFEGPEDGESPLKECRSIEVQNCFFDLRYPMWHDIGLHIDGCTFTIKSRAPLWYCCNVTIDDSRLECVKPLRECAEILIKGSTIQSEEAIWRSNEIQVEDSTIVSNYAFFMCNQVRIQRMKLGGKYTFQYNNDLVIEDSELDTKDAFWHSKNVTIRNCTIKGEYLGWYSENLHLVDCTIIGTQPLCYCKGLVLENCTMVNCDLAFEYSEVEASLNGRVHSIKNPLSGRIVLDELDEYIGNDPVYPCSAEVIIRK